MGILCLAFLIPVQMAKDFKFKDAQNCAWKKALNATWWLIVTGRNAIIVVITGVVAILSSGNTFTLTNEIKLGLPDFELPDFELKVNETVIIKDFTTSLTDLKSGIVVVGLIGLMETVAVS